MGGAGGTGFLELSSNSELYLNLVIIAIVLTLPCCGVLSVDAGGALENRLASSGPGVSKPLPREGHLY